MKQIIKNLFFQFLFWLILFNTGRILFLVYSSYDLDGVTIIEILTTFLRSIYLDVSTISYFLILPFLFSIFQGVIKWKGFDYLIKGFNFILLVAVVFIIVSEPILYEEWRTKINDKALKHLTNHPDEVIKTASWTVTMVGLIVVAALITFGVFLFNKGYKNIIYIKRSWFLWGVYLLLTPLILIIGIRGGLQPIPITQSDVYFSNKHNILNLTAVNSVWNLGHSFSSNLVYSNNNPYNYYPIEEAKEVVDSLIHNVKDSTYQVIVKTKPNIVFYILESWSADLVGVLDGDSTITKNFNELAKEGLLFTHVLASGDRSDQSMGAIYSAFPTQPTTSIIDIQSKQKNLPFLMDPFKRMGYHTAYYFGGDLSYGNISGYMFQHEVDEIIQQRDLPKNTPTGKLGIQDMEMQKIFLEGVNKMSEPFFASFFTLSSHSPYDMDFKWQIKHGGKDRDYLNSVYYSDSALGTFVQSAKKQDWYKNSLVVIMADHSHPTPENRKYHEWKNRHIPMLFIGGALDSSYIGKEYTQWTTHADLATTILKQLGKDKEAESYYYSNNMFNYYRNNFVYYSFNDGVSLVNDSAYISYDHNYKVYQEKYFHPEWDSLQRERFVKEAKSYLQVMFEDYVDMDKM